MAINLITNPPTVPVTSPDNWTQFILRSDANMKGIDFPGSVFCLTNWDTGTSKPEICEGSIFEVGGSFYQADSDTALTDESGISDGQVHIKLVPNAGGTAVIPTLTSDSIPTWDSTKYGWYDSDDKFLHVEMTRSGAVTKVFTSKFVYDDQNNINKTYADGGRYIGGDTEIDGSLTVNSGATFGGALSGITNLTASGNISCDDISCDDITCDDISLSGSITSTLYVDGRIYPRTPSTTGSTSLSSGATYTFPRGVYLVSRTTDVNIEGYISSSWQTVGTDAEGLYFSDGINIRANNTGGSTRTLDWLVF